MSRIVLGLLHNYNTFVYSRFFNFNILHSFNNKPRVSLYATPLTIPRNQDAPLRNQDPHLRNQDAPPPRPAQPGCAADWMDALCVCMQAGGGIMQYLGMLVCLHHR